MPGQVKGYCSRYFISWLGQVLLEQNLTREQRFGATTAAELYTPATNSILKCGRLY